MSNQNESIFSILENLFDSLSKGHRKIATYLLRHKAEVLAMTAKELSNEIGVSEATLIRFARAVGCTNYKELQQAIKRDSMQKSSVMKIYDELLEERALESQDYIKIVRKDIDNVNKTLEKLNIENLYSLVERIIKARKIGVIGSRGDAAPAVFLQHYLNEMFGNTVLLQPGNGDSYDRIRDWSDEDLIIAFAYWDNSYYERTLMNYASKRNCHIFTITREQAVSMQSLSDEFIIVETKGAFLSYTSSVVLVNVILELVANQLPSDTVHRIFKNVEEILDIINSTPTQ